MSLEQLSYLAQIFASVGVIVSLIFVGLQIKHNTGALQRDEHNSTMAQWTVIRMAIAKNRDIAELMTAGPKRKSFGYSRKTLKSRFKFSVFFRSHIFRSHFDHVF